MSYFGKLTTRIDNLIDETRGLMDGIEDEDSMDEHVHEIARKLKLVETYFNNIESNFDDYIKSFDDPVEALDEFEELTNKYFNCKDEYVESVQNIKQQLMQSMGGGAGGAENIADLGGPGAGGPSPSGGGPL